MVNKTLKIITWHKIWSPFLSLYLYLPPTITTLTLKAERSNFSSNAVGKIIAEAEAKKNHQQNLSNSFANVIEKISVFALAIPLAVFGSYFGNVVLFN